jgi:hypothetical protein
MESKRSERGLFANKTRYWVVISAVLMVCSSIQAEWKPADGPLMTQWAKEVSPNNAHPEYPRPQMVRKDWLNLNGLWEYAITTKDKSKPAKFDGQILVPFPIESALSGVMKPVGEKNRLWYRRTFRIPRKWKGQRLLLHFGAVDWDTTVWVNGKELGNHRGGYDPFTFDITDALKDTGKQEIILAVWDPTNAGSQPRGKQVKKPGGIWYTAVTGIWQTVWLEPVPETYINRLVLTPDVDNKCLHIVAKVAGPIEGMGIKPTGGPVDALTIEVTAYDGTKEVATAASGANDKFHLTLADPKLWSPDSPHLYKLRIGLKKTVDDKTFDTVRSYFGMRKIEVKKDEAGINRLFLNNKVLFQYGPLDQGWWPDGLYTAPTDEALRYDIEVLKKIGCNMLRKHVKVEPARLYYWCDKLGLMVWQDMASGNNKTDADKKQFELELKRMIETFHNHPCIVMWVPFNEGWGQHDTPRYSRLVKEWDPTRLVNEASGWANRESGDVRDIHSYPGPAAPPNEEKRASVLGEFGGLGLPVKGHTWQDEKNWGYRSYETREQLTTAYVALLSRLRPMIGGGLCAAVYTQTTDVEIEVNGFMTYDRAMVKANIERITAANRKLYLPPPIIKTIVQTSQKVGVKWSYTTSKPGDGWQKPNFDDSSWKKGCGGFGTEGTPGSIIRTEWKSSDIWLRRTFKLKDNNLNELHLSIHHDEDAEVYINGMLATKLSGYTTSYVQAPINEVARRTLKAGSNCIAVHCHQTGGGQYIDVGLAEVVEQSAK